MRCLFRPASDGPCTLTVLGVCPPQEMLAVRTVTSLLLLALMPAAVLSLVLLSLSPTSAGQQETDDDASPGLR